jgi:hypothetical protein
MPRPRGIRTVDELIQDARKKKKVEEKTGASPLLWGGIAAAVLGVVLVLVLVLWPSSKPQLSEDQLQKQRDQMIQQIQSQAPDKGKRK